MKELEADGIIQRKVIPTVPVQVEYAVTEHGKTLFPILDAMCDWGCKNSNGRYVMTHPTCKEEYSGYFEVPWEEKSAVLHPMLQADII